jgi:hypothetical protein
MMKAALGDTLKYRVTRNGPRDMGQGRDTTGHLSHGSYARPSPISDWNFARIGVASRIMRKPTWTAALVIEGLTAFYRSLAGVGPHVSERARPGCQRHPTRTAPTEGRMALGQNALVARHGDQA